MESLFCSDSSSVELITTKFCTWHDSYAVVACAKICFWSNDQKMNYYEKKFSSRSNGEWKIIIRPLISLKLIRQDLHSSENGLSPGLCQAIIWTNAGILLIRTLGTNFSEILSEIHKFSFKKMHVEMSSAKWRPFCFSLNLLTPLVLNQGIFWENQVNTMVDINPYCAGTELSRFN